jgi:hypothetical protein
MKETELAQHFVDYLSCYDLYYEVECSSGRVDIVALDRKIRMAFEVKTSFNFKVLEQAINNYPYFHYSYIAVPYFRGGYIQERLCRDYGIGLIVCNANRWMSGNVEECVKARLNRHADNKFSRIELSEANKRSIPGSSGAEGGRMTPFKQTVENMVKYVRRNPGCSLGEMFKEIQHHYSSFAGAKSSTYHWLRSGVISEIKLDNGKLYLNPISTDSQTSQPTSLQ